MCSKIDLPGALPEFNVVAINQLGLLSRRCIVVAGEFNSMRYSALRPQQVRAKFLHRHRAARLHEDAAADREVRALDATEVLTLYTSPTCTP